MEMALTGQPITSDEAKNYGLVSRVTDNGGTIDAALELAEQIAENAPLAVAASKALIQAQQGITEESFGNSKTSHGKGLHFKRCKGRSSVLCRKALT